jgi:hypothetical protein
MGVLLFMAFFAVAAVWFFVASIQYYRIEKEFSWELATYCAGFLLCLILWPLVF